MSKVQVVAAIIQKDRRFLLGKRSLQKNSSPGRWSPISGRIEMGESEIDALERECFEEVGLVVKAKRKISEFDIENGKTRIHWWTVSIVSGEAVLKNDEHTVLRWFSESELNTEENINSEDSKVFRDFVNQMRVVGSNE
jgi:8-oxo-dGTP pyrophosphatase MutT (NUDIX family)